MPRILIADHDEDVSEALEDLLALEGYQPERAESLEAALDAVDRQLFDAVVTDTFAAAGESPLQNAALLAARARPTPVGVLSHYQFLRADLERNHLAFALLKPPAVNEFFAELARVVGGPLGDGDARALLARSYFKSLGQRDWDGVLATCAEQVVFAGPQQSRFGASLRGRRALREHCEKTFASFADTRFEDTVVYATPNGVAARYLASWTARGERVRQAGSTLFHIEDGLIRRIGVETNAQTLERLAP